MSYRDLSSDSDDMTEEYDVTFSTIKRSSKSDGYLQKLDVSWYVKLNPRYLDIVGDYCGQELFLIEGDALIQRVLDDPFLKLGDSRQEDFSFQIVHAVHILEKFLLKFLKRECVFEIVFFQELHVFGNQQTSKIDLCSRRLAASILKKHCFQISFDSTTAPPTHHTIVVRKFSGLDDPEWEEYLHQKKPFFILTSDGGIKPNLLRRSNFARLCEEITGMGVCVFEGLDFKDSKIFSFVYDSRFGTVGKNKLARKVHKYVTTSLITKPMVEEVQMTNGVSKEYKFLHLVASVFQHRGSSNEMNDILLQLWIAHSLLLKQLPLPSRIIETTKKMPSSLTTILRDSFLPTLYQAIIHVIDDEKTCIKVEEMLDIDGRVFLELVNLVLERKSAEEVVGSCVWEKVGEIINSKSSHAKELSSFYSNEPKETTPKKKNQDPLELLPFSHSLIDDLLSPIMLSLPPSTAPIPPPAFFNFSTYISDDRHWHNSKQILPYNKITPDPTARQSVISEDRKRWLLKKKLQRDQRFKATLHRQADSLAGQAGMIKINIVVDKKIKANNRGDQKVKSTWKKEIMGKKEMKVVLSKKDKIIAENVAKKKSQIEVSAITWWASQISSLRDKDFEIQMARLDSFRNNKYAEDIAWLQGEIILYRVHIIFSNWKDNEKTTSSLKADEYRVQILQQIIKLVDKKSSLLSEFPPSYLKIVQDVFDILGLNDMSKEYLSQVIPSLIDRQLSFKFIKLMHKGYPITLFRISDPDVWQFQLRVFGEYMDRSVGGAPDSRVPFEPDAWQREVLNNIDLHQSMMVCAPTSSGKTFIGYAAMQQVLKESDDSIAVYLAPTKALVNQVAAETYARFSKDFGNSARTVWAIHSRDYRVNDPEKCQILITVPQILLIMLLSPPLARRWSPRIRWVIFDEIHNIGNEDGGAVWQQLLLLVTSPIIALSATVGSPERFAAWLEHVQSAHGHKFSFIHHKQRYNALRKFMYAPKNLLENFNGFDLSHSHSLRSQSSFIRIHPLASLNNNSSTLPEDLALEPSDCLTLFEELNNVFPNKYHHLRPCTFFKDQPVLRIVDVVRYEESLKNELKKLMISNHNGAEQIITHLSEPLRQSIGSAVEENDLDQSLFSLILDLRYDNSLPAIIFNFDRSLCEQAAKRILEELLKAEEKWKAGSVIWRRKMEEYKIWEGKRKDRERKTEMETKRIKQQDSLPEESYDPFTDFDPNAPLPQFNLANLKGKYSLQEVSEIISEMGYVGLKPWFTDALKRGIGVHHAGMPYKYRTIVETLFRSGHLTVVVSTGTLAMGINMPCKSVVFFGDSIWLTSLNYRQCSGRSGRRGFDLIGKVIFHGLPLKRIQRLLSSRLPSLNGSFPLTTTMVLQLLSLLTGSKNAPQAEKSIRQLFQVDRMSVAAVEGKLEMLHFLRFSIDYLRRIHVLDSEGFAINLSSLATHLYYEEPSNFAFLVLLQEGIIHKICSEIHTKPISVLRELMLIICHCFGRIHFRKKSQYLMEERIKNTSSIVILPPLPKNVQRALKEHNNLVQKVYTGYVLTYSKEYVESFPEEKQLPLSRLYFPTSTEVSNQFFEHLKDNVSSLSTRSVFAGLSGSTDDFSRSSIAEVVETVREGVHLNKHAVPTFTMFTGEDVDDDHIALNAYGLDFFKHGSIPDLINGNGIKRGAVWPALQNLSLALASLKEAIWNVLLEAAKHRGFEGEGEEDKGLMELEREVEAEGDFNEDTMECPSFVKSADWDVFLAISLLKTEFDVKFKKTWA